MTWEEFHKHYVIEVFSTGTVLAQFMDNTPLYPLEKPTLSKISYARVLDKFTQQTVREYPIELNNVELRSVNNRLRRLIIRDFQIVETEFINNDLKPEKSIVNYPPLKL